MIYQVTNKKFQFSKDSHRVSKEQSMFFTQNLMFAYSLVVLSMNMCCSAQNPRTLQLSYNIPDIERTATTSQSSRVSSPFPIDVRSEIPVDGYFDLPNLLHQDGVSLLEKSKTVIGVIDQNHILVRWEGIVDYVIEDAAPKVGDNMIQFWAAYDDILSIYKALKTQCHRETENKECVAESTISAGTSYYHFYFRGSKSGTTIVRVIELSQYGKEQATIAKEKADLESFKNTIVSSISQNHFTPLMMLDTSSDEIQKEIRHLRTALNVHEETIETFLQSQINHLQNEGMVSQLHEVFKARNALQEINKRIDRFGKAFRSHLMTVTSQTSELRQKTLHMLAYSDVCSNKLDIRMRDKLNLLDLCEEAHRIFSSAALSKGVEFETFMSAGQFNPYVQIDAEKFKQALFAPLQNAVQYSHINGQPIRFEFNMNDNAEITFTIRDFGCGISSENIPLVCEAFYSHHPLRGNEQSLGLGLFLAKTFIEAMDGKIYIESEEGVSTRITITIPLRHVATHQIHLRSTKVNEHETPQNNIQKHQRHISSQYQKASSEPYQVYDTVLISEDNEIAGRALKRQIEKAGFKTELCKTGEAALERYKLQPSRFFLACLDYYTPPSPLTGAEIGVLMREISAQFPIMIISANVNRSVRDDVTAKGIDLFMSKPYDRKKLAEVLQHFSEKAHEQS